MPTDASDRRQARPKPKRRTVFQRAVAPVHAKPKPRPQPKPKSVVIRRPRAAPKAKPPPVAKPPYQTLKPSSRPAPAPKHSTPRQKRQDRIKADRGGKVLATGSFMGPKTKLQKAAAPKVQARATARAKRRERKAALLNRPTMKPATRAQAAESAKHPVDWHEVLAEQGVSKLPKEGLRRSGFGAPTILTRGLTQIGEGLIQSPGGMYHTAGAIKGDLEAADKKLSGREGGDLSFKRSRKFGKALAISVARDVMHPRENIGYLAMDVGAVVTGGYSGGARAIAGKGAYSAGRAAGKSVVRSTGAGLKKAAKRPVSGSEILHHGDLDVAAPLLDNPLAAKIQKTYHKLTPLHNQKRVGKRLARQASIEEDLARAPAEALKARGRRATTGQEAAITSRGEGVPPRERRARELEWARQSKGMERRRHKVLARVYKGAARHTDVDAGGKVVFTGKSGRTLLDRARRAGVSPQELERLYQATKASSTRRTESIIARGDLHPNTAEARIHAPGQVVRTGAKIKTRSATPAAERAGQLTIDEAPRYVPTGKTRVVQGREIVPEERLAHLRKVFYHVPTKKSERPGLVEQVRRELYGEKLDPDAKFEQDLRNERAGREAKGKAAGSQAERNKLHGQGVMRGVTGKRPTVKQEQAMQAEDVMLMRLHKAAAKGDESAKAALRAYDEMEELRVHVREGDPFSKAEAPPRPRATKTVPELREVLPEKPVQTGEFRIPSVPVRQHTGVPTRQTRGAVGFARKDPALTHEYSGSARVQGLERQDTTALVAESELVNLKYERVLKNRERLLKAVAPPEEVQRAAAAGRLLEDYAPVRTEVLKGKVLSPAQKVLLERESKGGPLSAAEKRDLGKHYNDFIDRAFPQGVVDEADPGIAWVPRKVADGILPEPELTGRISTHGKRLTTAVDVTNDTMKAGLLYLKGPGYVLPNLAGQGFLGVAHQGAHLPKNMADAWRLGHGLLDPEDWQRFKAIGGQGQVRGVLGNRSRFDIAKMSWLVGIYEKILDTPFRTSGVVHELKRRGVPITRDGIHDFLNAPDNAHLRVEVADAGRNAYIDFGKMNAAERNIVMRAFFLYPWLKGSAKYTLRFLVEHPIQAAALVKLGEQQGARNDRELGPQPDWFEQLGSFKVGGSDKFPLTSNPASATILGQFPSIVEDVRKHGIKAIPHYLSPVASLIEQEAFGIDPFTGKPTHGDWKEVLQHGTYEQFPGFQAIFPDATPPPGQSMYPGNRRWTALRKMGGGTMVPRVTDRELMNERARQADLDAMSPVKRVTHQRDEALKQVDKVAHRLHLPPKMAKLAKKAITLEHARAEGLAHFADHKSMSASDVSPADQMAIEVTVLVQNGLMSRREAAITIRVAREFQAKGKMHEVSEAASALWNARVPSFNGRRWDLVWREGLEENGIAYLGRKRWK